MFVGFAFAARFRRTRRVGDVASLSSALVTSTAALLSPAVFSRVAPSSESGRGDPCVKSSGLSSSKVAEMRFRAMTSATAAAFSDVGDGALLAACSRSAR